MGLKIATLTRQEVPIVRLKGELDVSQGTKLQNHIAHMVAEGRLNLVLSLVQLDYLDSSGLGSLVALAKMLRSKGGRMVLITNDFVDEILAITRLGEIFETADSERSALEVLERTP